MSEHRRSGRHTKPSEKNEINHMEETKHYRASAGSSGSVKGEDPRAQMILAFIRLESTNFMAKAICGSLSSKEMQEAIEKALVKSGVDILELVAHHFVYKCSYHQGNRFIGLNVRVFEPPRSESGQLLDSETTIAEKIEGGFLVEVQLREGDRLHFSSLFRKLLTNFSELEGVTPTGTLRYKPQPSPRKGEGLVLESIKISRSSSFGMKSLFETVPQGDGDSTIESLDEEGIKDILKLAEVLRSGFLDTQADAATAAVAGLTSDAEFLEQLSDPKAKKVLQSYFLDTQAGAATAVVGLTSDDVAESSAAITSASSFTAPPPHDPQGSVSEISDDRSQAVEDELIEQNTGNDNPMPEFGVSRGSRRPIWDYLCQSTGQAATSNCTLVVTIFCSATVTGIAEENDPLWISSLSVVVLLFAATSVAFCLALPEVARNSRVTSEEPPV